MYMQDFAVYRPPEEHKVDFQEILRAVADPKHPMYGRGCGEESCLENMRKFYESSGMLYPFMPPSCMSVLPDGTYQDIGVTSMGYNKGLEEAKMNLFGVMDLLLEQTGVDPREIQILVTVCAAFNSIPSMASLVVNKYKMKSNIMSFHLGGMACAGGLISVQLVRDLLKAHPNTNAVILTTEICNGFSHSGNDIFALASNVLFRQGAAAMLFTNKPGAHKTAKYQLLHGVRCHIGADDGALTCMGMFEDCTGKGQPFFTPGVAKYAMKAVTKAVTMIAPKVLTWSQLATAAGNMMYRRMYGEDSVEPYKPSFADCIDHFALHPGVHVMLMGFMKGLKLPKEKALPSFAALRDYGNTAASSTYYVMAYLESMVGIQKGETIMQLSVGTGIKSAVNVWRALRDIEETHHAWAHLNGVPVTEADLPRPISIASSEDMKLATKEFDTYGHEKPKHESAPVEDKKHA